MNQALPDRGTKRTCLHCESRFYDLARVPAICPKCGTEYVEIVRPAPTRPQIRKRGSFAKELPAPPAEVEDGEVSERESAAEGEEHEPDGLDEGIDHEAEPAPEAEELEE